ncbi:hypothetical protein ACFVYD_12100 [Streptomyces sp. NPDC058301]|uniref:hypothetical protein n=1 Tax=Streptomyces sp. NPDC058301 TaxID=3346436 RepID=UPI0036F09B0D
MNTPQRPATYWSGQHTYADGLGRRQRPAGTDDLFVAWETLTHADHPGRPSAV